ncbi:hypothetical protein Y1Q_0012847 [Alligator mississippiensis]|uniref:Uncharacterized protein n=1 Tax=Alligator mississippiensis TaxID=8496 RepID=A0A151P4D5_ALLMI|nr:hypothetical protein Y1Q_0012847 [Alligator mississippiensis]
MQLLLCLCSSFRSYCQASLYHGGYRETIPEVTVRLRSGRSEHTGEMSSLPYFGEVYFGVEEMEFHKARRSSKSLTCATQDPLKE